MRRPVSSLATMACAALVATMLALQAGCGRTATTFGWGPAPADDSPRAAIASAHPLASEAGIEMIRSGGNAVDAALAAAFMLSVVEPHAGGPGGGGFILFHDAERGVQRFLDYRERAPAALTREHLTEDGELSAAALRRGGLAVATPGMVRGLLMVHEEEGRLPLSRVLQPAIEAAEEGFPVSAHLSQLSSDRFDMLVENEAAAELFLADGIFPLEEGQLIENPAIARTFQDIAARGATAFYTGARAEHLVRTVGQAGGVLEMEDLAEYEPTWRTPIRGEYRGHEIVTIGPPSAGGIQVLLMLSVLEGYDLSGLDPNDPAVLALLLASGEAALSLAREYVGDPDAMEVSVSSLLSEERVEEIRSRVNIEPARTATPLPRDFSPVAYGDDGNTTHLSVIDPEGNAVALTQTINYFFGSGVASGDMGFMLNNEMADFDVVEGSPNFPEAGRIPRSSMTPVLVFHEGELVATLGSPGATRIPLAVVRILSGKLDFDLTLEEAIDLPRVFADPGPAQISFESRIDESAIEEALSLVEMQEEDYSIRAMSDFHHYFGGAHACWIALRPDGTAFLEAAADRRRDGEARTLPPPE